MSRKKIYKPKPPLVLHTDGGLRVLVNAPQPKAPKTQPMRGNPPEETLARAQAALKAFGQSTNPTVRRRADQLRKAIERGRATQIFEAALRLVHAGATRGG